MEFKVRIEKKAFLKALQMVNGINVQKDIYPILENVKITVENFEMKFRVTDLKISITTTISGDSILIEEDGEVLLPTAKLYNLIKDTPDKELFFKQEGLNGVIVCEDGTFSLLGESVEKFPDIPEFKEVDFIEVTGEDFKRLIKKTIFATTTEKTRYDLDNVLIEIDENNNIKFVATDGKRLAICQKKYLSDTIFEPKEATVPFQSLHQIDKVLSTDIPEKIKIGFIERQLLVKTNDVTISTVLSNAKFPPYEKVIPNDLPFEAKLEGKKLLSSLKRICYLSDEKNKIVQLSFDVNTLKIFTRSEGSGEAIISLPIEFKGEPFSINFNPVFLIDVLKVVDNNILTVQVKDKNSPLLLKDGDDFTYIVLPIKIEN